MNNIEIKLDRPLGEFQVRKLRGDEVTYDSGLCDNLVVDNFYHFWAERGFLYSTSTGTNTTDIMYYCAVSNDSNEVSIEDTNLSGQISTRTHYSETSPSITIEVIDDKQYYKISKRYLWGKGDFNNVTISKVGLLHTTTGNDRLVAGQLIRDGSGNPVTVTILADEQLDITYTLYIPILEDKLNHQTGSLILNSIEYEYEVDLMLSNLTSLSGSTLYGRTPYLTTNESGNWNNGNRFWINSTLFTSKSGTRTNYPRRTELVFHGDVPSGPTFNPITSISFFELGYPATASGVGGYRANVPLVVYRFTDANKPVKLPTDSYEHVVKLTIKWGED